MAAPIVWRWLWGCSSARTRVLRAISETSRIRLEVWVALAEILTAIPLGGRSLEVTAGSMAAVDPVGPTPGRMADGAVRTHSTAASEALADAVLTADSVVRVLLG